MTIFLLTVFRDLLNLKCQYLSVWLPHILWFQLINKLRTTILLFGLVCRWNLTLEGWNHIHFTRFLRKKCFNRRLFCSKLLHIHFTFSNFLLLTIWFSLGDKISPKGQEGIHKSPPNNTPPKSTYIISSNKAHHLKNFQKKNPNRNWKFEVGHLVNTIHHEIVAPKKIQ